ncbi:MAG: EF-P lysine aminoacylase GenX [Proteobacteria bacterium]|nr:EF-P lysine aminoacylase GenX [Pseudomonadota bacterium]MBU1739130.1 EF-P lysine aminoacylase GenX [Pseudomonadota bacterium]
MVDLEKLRERAAIIQAVRSFFISREYLEVQTPVRLPAIAPEPWIEPLTSEGQFLQTSPELCMKRLLSAGAERVFQICPCFRKGERGRLHLSEFTMLEWYRAGAEYSSLMTECEEMVRFVAADFDPAIVKDWGDPWPRITVAEAFRQYCRISVDEALATDMFEESLVEEIEPALAAGGPVFLYDYPASQASLARLRKDNPEVAERFELYIDGIEIANGFSELTDREEQHQRFSRDRELIQASGRKPGPFPGNFIEELSRMPEAAGIALGLDRLVMVLTGSGSIDEVVSFTPEEL